MDKNEILTRLKGILQTVKPNTNIALVTPATQLQAELGIDSLSMMLLALAIETEFNFRFDTVTPFKTVGEVCDYIASKTA